ncbi:hypothetical protein AB0G73_33545 [Streptomyces sp. NPDC020719]|uniref:hypothetical protein n=1 Tax=Streptomyces sp. NPDC020719 TaxID=3154896 RepID=UPI0033EC08EE
MTSKFKSKNWALTAVTAMTAAMALVGTVGATGATAADAASASSITASHSAAAPAGSVLVKKVKTAQGTIDIYRNSAAGVRPFSSSGCAGGSFEVCIDINGGGTFVYYIQNTTHFPSAGTVNMQINGPSGVIAQTGAARRLPSGGNPPDRARRRTGMGRSVRSREGWIHAP